MAAQKIRKAQIEASKKIQRIIATANCLRSGKTKEDCGGVDTSGFAEQKKKLELRGQGECISGRVCWSRESHHLGTQKLPWALSGTSQRPHRPAARQTGLKMSRQVRSCLWNQSLCRHLSLFEGPSQQALVPLAEALLRTWFQGLRWREECRQRSRAALWRGRRGFRSAPALQT